MSLHLVPRALLYLETVARLGSIQAASRALGIAASAIDRQVIALEDACQAPLFERHPRGMRLTTAGESVVLLARRWQDDADRLEAELREMRGEQYGTVRLGAMDSLSNSVLPLLVDTIARDHPRIHLAIEILSPPKAAADLDSGAIDLAIVFNLPADRWRHVLWSAPLPFGCIVGPGHPLWGVPETTLNEAARFPMAAQSRDLPVREYLDRRYGWLFDPVEPVLVSNSQQLMKKALQQGRLMAITSELTAISELRAGELWFARLTDPGLKPQTISVAVDARRPLLRAARLVGDALSSIVEGELAARRTEARA
ncbi:LysR family transcriptional regulator [Pararhodobacter marinus]|uniref:LysR family transcriptional regulator n=1 Tax=Pararhodobacter marinus TaxID=2184063 RepID=UPI0035197337